ncbi:MAG: hypothetical protein CMF42_03600 [Legionellales bacterium]|nr:hypothetical protein [Legionellales bacterium]|tara:strand:+ start:3257 stop:3751 length:495 start_codon:yes stop_codon:yes gene_type:complete
MLKSPKLFFSIAGLLSLAPFLMVGWWYLLGQPNPTLQKGRLVQETVLFNIPQSDPPKWIIGQVVKNQCQDDCMGKMYLLDRIRLVMGKNQNRVDVALLSESPIGIENYTNITDPNLKNISNVIGDDDLVIIDPQHKLVMSYSKDVDPRNITADLKKLLKFSRLG